MHVCVSVYMGVRGCVSCAGLEELYTVIGSHVCVCVCVSCIHVSIVGLCGSRTVVRNGIAHIHVCIK